MREGYDCEKLRVRHPPPQRSVVSGQLARLRLEVSQASEIDSGGLRSIVSHISELRCGAPGDEAGSGGAAKRGWSMVFHPSIESAAADEGWGSLVGGHPA